ncbi:Glycosylphosphatidylinositol:protein transamidase, GAA1 component [Pseudovirgaria hyperparasitica]|uniref:Glycosylphosphatidylinositol:protein transamidase, GAA1 component n=1 Tax=Pseudovirgaria hyperparasitica TaxID=470096 RepID=A0A6A6W8H8_9PEZI|nr:Glycosylphosphatidylinositol:protein transamidase, GAA1 component [Pseudovirgaria hyperparasitica]KAF2758260.1 Glycosylphosphatidylinositol:protein transamidase, GAA1 component [Pseudovirgaria hyperparasitica]
MTLLSSILGLRRDERLLKIPPYLSALLVIVGCVWLCLLPLDEYSRKTYISENALLPGQVHTYFGGSEHNVFRAYRHEVAGLVGKSEQERSQKLGDILRLAGLKVATQKYEYDVSGRKLSGENVYAVLQGPRADATEAVVMIASWKTMNGDINHSGVALLLTLARYMKRWSLWSKDVIFLISGDSREGPQAWVDAYHNAVLPASVEPLTIKSGALQGAVAIEYPAGPWGHRFDKLHILYDGTNGQLSNLDLFNTAVQIASNQMGIGCTLQRMFDHKNTYEERLQTMLRGMVNQGLGHSTGPHSSFIPYHVDAITLQTVGDGWHDEMGLGKVVESLFRSLNNLLEHLHQSFFLYLLLQAKVFVSIGTYLPSAMLVAANFTVTCIALWVQSGRPLNSSKATSAATPGASKEEKMVVIKEKKSVALVPASTLAVVERKMFFPLAYIAAAHFLGLIPFYLFNNSPEHVLRPLFHATTAITLVLPIMTATAVSQFRRPTQQETTLIQCFSLLLLGMFLSALATLNFSLSFIIGVLAVPLSFVRRIPNSTVLPCLMTVILTAVSPMMVATLATQHWHYDVVDLLLQAAQGWHIWGMWTQVVVWLVWFPAWFAGASIVVWSLPGL